MSHQGHAGWYPECLVCNCGNLGPVVCLNPSCHEQHQGQVISGHSDHLIERDGHFWKPCRFCGHKMLADPFSWGSFALCAGCWNRRTLLPRAARYRDLSQALTRPEAFSVYTIREMWDDPFISGQMLTYHLNPDVDISSRRASFIASSSDWMIDRFDLGDGKRVLDLGCGPGLYSSRLAGDGASVTGVDFSRNSIDYARKEAGKLGLDIDYRLGSYLEEDLPGNQNLVLIAMCDYCALGPKERGLLLGKIREALADGGSFLFDGYTETAFEKREETSRIAENLMEGFWSPDPYVGILSTMKYPEEKVVLDRYLIVEEARSRSFFNWLQYFSSSRLEAELAGAGLALSELLGDIGGGPYSETATEFAAVAGEA